MMEPASASNPAQASAKGWLRSWWLQQGIIGKYVVLLVGAALLIGPIGYFAMSSMLAPAFEQIEQEQVTAQKARVAHALNEFETRLQNMTMDYAVWDDMYKYVEHPNDAFVANTLTPTSHVNNSIDYRGIVDIKRNVIWSSMVDLKAAKLMPAESEAMKSVIADPQFFARASATRATKSYVRTAQGIFLLTTGRIIHSNESGPVVGVMINGRLLKEASLSDALQVKARLNLNVPQALGAQIAAAPGQSLSTTGASEIVSHVGVSAADGKLLGSIEFSTPRDVSAVGLEASRSAALLLLLLIASLIMILAYGLRAITIRRVQALENHVRTFGTNHHPLDASLLEGADEVASLSRQFDAISKELSTASEQLRQNAYVQGKADSAAGMLHNVRNAIAPIRILQEKWLREDSLPYRANMQRAVAELAEDGIAPDRKASLEQFLVTAARQIALTQQGRLTELEESKESIDQVSQILASYNFDTSGSSVGEVIDLLQMVKLSMRKVDARDGGAVEWSLPDELPSISGNRVHLGQVLDNLFVNAHEAMIAAGTDPMRIEVSAEQDAAAGTVTLRIKDNGDGIDPANIAKIFHRGFSTRNHKAGGIGMHWSANAMRAMGGSVALESEGAGCGATAVLVLREATSPQAATPQALAA